MNGEHKITSSHRERAAICYLRQSSMAQVRQHTESTRSQYGLAETAAGLVETVRGHLRRGEQVDAVLAEISAINAELLARRELE